MMDIVEQLRKHQCPENKGCNPVVEYCQCALMDSGADEIERLREALKPFAEIADDWDHLEDKDYVSVHRYDISIKHFRAIRSALQQKETE